MPLVHGVKNVMQKYYDDEKWLNAIKEREMKKITFSEYQEAKKIVIAYENEQQRLENTRLEEFKIELAHIFLNNDFYEIEQFNLRKEWNGYKIIPQKPCLEEGYNGELDDEIEKLCLKHNFIASIVGWCYHK